MFLLSGYFRYESLLIFVSFFATRRATLAINVSNFTKLWSDSFRKPITPVYIYGHRTINFAENRKILLSTIEYIKETRRFSTWVYSPTPSTQPCRNHIYLLSFLFYTLVSICMWLLYLLFFFYILVLCYNFLVWLWLDFDAKSSALFSGIKILKRKKMIWNEASRNVINSFLNTRRDGKG